MNVMSHHAHADEARPRASADARNATPWAPRDASGTHRFPELAHAAEPHISPSAAAGSSYVVIDLATLGIVILLTLGLFADAAGSAVLGRTLLFGGTVQIGLKTALGLYPGFGLHPDARLRRSFLAWAGAGGISVAAILYLVPISWAAFGLFCAAFIATGLLQTLGRKIMRIVLKRSSNWGVPVHLCGTPDAVKATRTYLRAHPGIGFRPVDRQTPADIVLWADHNLPSAATLKALRRGRQDVILVSDLPRTPLSGVHPAEHGGEIGLHLALAHGRSTPPVHAVKRLFDLAFAVPLTLIALPIVAIAGALIWCVDPGPVFYVQPREGRGGKTIGVLKLRTMYLDAEQMLQDLLARDADVRAEWETHFKLRKDPRILPYIGKFLRASSLDELPQLLNILRGDMSLVGPRPFPDYHLAAMPLDFRNRRASVIPGLTGLWQISERSSADLEGQQQLDDFYINGRSFWGDVSILLRTFAAVLGRRGAY